MTGAIAAAGLTAVPGSVDDHHTAQKQLALATASHSDAGIEVGVSNGEPARGVETNVVGPAFEHATGSHAAVSAYHAEAGAIHTQAFAPQPLPDATQHFDSSVPAPAVVHALPMAATVAIPGAEMLQTLGNHGRPDVGQDKAADIGHVLADALAGGGGHGPNIEALVESATAHGQGRPAGIGIGHFASALAAHDVAAFVGAGHVQTFVGLEMLDAHQAAASVA